MFEDSVIHCQLALLFLLSCILILHLVHILTDVQKLGPRIIVEHRVLAESDVRIVFQSAQNLISWSFQVLSVLESELCLTRIDLGVLFLTAVSRRLVSCGFDHV